MSLTELSVTLALLLSALGCSCLILILAREVLRVLDNLLKRSTVSIIPWESIAHRNSTAGNTRKVLPGPAGESVPLRSIIQQDLRQAVDEPQRSSALRASRQFDCSMSPEFLEDFQQDRRIFRTHEHRHDCNYAEFVPCKDTEMTKDSKNLAILPADRVCGENNKETGKTRLENGGSLLPLGSFEWKDAKDLGARTSLQEAVNQPKRQTSITEAKTRAKNLDVNEETSLDGVDNLKEFQAQLPQENRFENFVNRHSTTSLCFPDEIGLSLETNETVEIEEKWKVRDKDQRQTDVDISMDVVNNDENSFEKSKNEYVSLAVSKSSLSLTENQILAINNARIEEIKNGGMLMQESLPVKNGETSSRNYRVDSKIDLDSWVGEVEALKTDRVTIENSSESLSPDFDSISAKNPLTKRRGTYSSNFLTVSDVDRQSPGREIQSSRTNFSDSNNFPAGLCFSFVRENAGFMLGRQGLFAKDDGNQRQMDAQGPPVEGINPDGTPSQEDASDYAKDPGTPTRKDTDRFQERLGTPPGPDKNQPDGEFSPESSSSRDVNHVGLEIESRGKRDTTDEEDEIVCRRPKPKSYDNSLVDKEEERQQISNCGKEEKDLNSIVRRMIAVELMKHRENQQITMQRSHSDTDSIASKRKTATGAKIMKQILEPVAIHDELCSIEAEDSKLKTRRFEERVEEVIISKSSAPVTSFSGITGSIIDLEGEEELQADFQTKAKQETSEKVYINDSSQTERVYMIHAVRSCPIRRKRFSLLFHLQRLTTNPPSSAPDLLWPIFRKASADLIYEKGKGRRSPAYVPVPERFRWKYLPPRISHCQSQNA